MEREVFYAKLCELDEDIHLMRTCLHTCQTMDAGDLQDTMEKLRAASEAWIAHLEDNIRRSRSPALSALAETQKIYYQQIRRVMEQELPAYLHSEASTPMQDRSEAGMLYAECAIDFARQSICHALFSALSAMSLEEQVEQEKEASSR